MACAVACGAVPPAGHPHHLETLLSTRMVAHVLVRRAVCAWCAQSAAARNLGTTRQTLRYRAQKYDLKAPDSESID